MTLTKRELEVVERLAHGEDAKTIAFALGISPKTVHIHRARCLKKSGCGNAAEITNWAILNNIAALRMPPTALPYP